MMMQLRTFGRLSAAAVLAIGSLLASAQAAGAAVSGAQVVPLHGAPVVSARAGGAAPSDAACRADVNIASPCYSPQEIRKAYGLTGLIANGDDGRGQTIVIIDSFGSPTAASDLATFDKDFGLPAPPSLRILAPLGTVPFDPTNSDQVGWAEETSLDVQWSHALAPRARIVVLTSPVSETEGVQGLPQFLKLEQYAVSHHLGNIISQSWAATENTLFTPQGKALMAKFNAFYRSATLHGVTFLASTGDAGTANPDVNGNIYPFPTVGFPAISPWVTAVGGTSLHATTNGTYQSENVWNDGDAGGAGGGGVSQYTPEPFYQRSLPAADQKLLAGHRAIPDISFNADEDTGVSVFLGFLGGDANGYYIFGGTSEGSPAWAGIVADLNERAGHPLGFLNPTLYALGAAHALYPAVLRDITVGDNAQPPIPGYSATPGWDAATGWGTPNLKHFANAFIKQDGHGSGGGY
jgi:subtilase family serine protease